LLVALGKIGDRMKVANFRKKVYFFLHDLRGQPLGAFYNRYVREDQEGIPPNTTRHLLADLLTHSAQNVPYYAQLMQKLDVPFYDDPEEYLLHFPILTKEIIRGHFDELKSSDLSKRKWFYNTSGGSTGEPARFIQDFEYVSRSGAVKILFSRLVGRDIGECEVRLWGSIRDVKSNTESWKATVLNWIENAVFVNTVTMTPDRMWEYLQILNSKQPQLVLAYAEPLYEMAKFAESGGLAVVPQKAIITSAGKLFPFMREKIEMVFQCRVYDRYGSREVGDIACEMPGVDGLWVAPWGNYIEVVDPEGNRVSDGTEGEILVTSLTNYAMPLIRYKIGDRGALSPTSNHSSKFGQVLREITGRSMDLFRTTNGELINPGYFMARLYFRDWISQFQIIQKSLSLIVYKFVVNIQPTQQELDEIAAITRNALGQDIEVRFEFVDIIPATSSGKYRYILSELQQ
jgi:phenylacetate-CoA ligase